MRFASGEVLPTRTVIWAAGVTANPLPAVLGLPTTRGGRVAVAPDLRVEGHDDVWALGDVAGALARRGDGVLPQLAPVAMQSGAHVARQIGRVLEGKTYDAMPETAPTVPVARVSRAAGRSLAVVG